MTQLVENTELNPFIEALSKACIEAAVPMPRVTHVQYEPAESCIERDQLKTEREYSYPECIHFNVEAWSTFKYSLRLVDGRFIQEGYDLQGTGIDQAELIRRVVANQAAHQERIKARERAEEEATALGMVPIETRRNEYVLVNPSVADAIGPRQSVLFKVIRADGSSHAWITFDTRAAVNEELTYYGRNPSPIVSIETVPDTDNWWKRA